MSEVLYSDDCRFQDLTGVDVVLHGHGVRIIAQKGAERISVFLDQAQTCNLAFALNTAGFGDEPEAPVFSIEDRLASLEEQMAEVHEELDGVNEDLVDHEDRISDMEGEVF